jgi:hypothetical protein
MPVLKSPFRFVVGALAAATLAAPAAYAMPVVWADTVVSFHQGPNEDPTNPNDPNSPLPFPSPAFSDPTAGLGAPDGGLVVLGAAGTITVSFVNPIPDLPGPDLFIVENPFVLPQGNFSEFGFVEVSSNGSDFVRFAAISDQPGPVDVFGLIDPALVHGLAGVGAMDPFDLADLPASALLDPANIRFVRIVDIVGDGNTFDSRGPGFPIYDPYPSQVTTGFDLDAIGAVPEPGSALLLALGALGVGALARRER